MNVRIDIVERILKGADIEGLFELGAPQDEYSQEAKLIVEALRTLEQPEAEEYAVLEIIRQIWVKMFGPFSNEQLSKRECKFRCVASQIVSNCTRTQ